MKNIIVITLLATTILFFSCKKKDKEDTTTPTFTKDKISGVSQKGPFLNGSSLTVYELDEYFAQTGKSFNTQILDNLGSFELSNITLLTHYAKLKADGYYYNEINNTNSIGPITLYALSDLSNKNTVNVNLLSTLEVSRVEYLIGNGSTFSDAKHLAQQEILNMFFIHKSFMSESELLNISVDGDDNAILLAISLVLQGYRTEAELSQLLGDIATDIRTDGILNSASLGSALINGAKLFDTTQIRSNIENKYSSLGITTVIPHFEKYIKQFLDSCTYTFTNYITFPDNGAYGINILNTKDSIFTMGGNYSCCANLPVGTNLKIFYQEDTVGTPGMANIAYETSSVDGWVDISPPWRTFKSSKCGLIDLHVNTITYNGSPGITTFYFYENNSVTPTRTKKIYVQ
jgi:hypothetical protein